MGNRDWKEEPSNGAKALDVVLLPSGEKFSGRSFGSRAEQGALLSVSAIDDSLLAKLSSARGIVIDMSGAQLIEMDFPSPSAALAQLRKCSDELLVEWGIDAAALAALKHKAVGIVQPADLFSDADYPESALRAGKQGDVVARLDIDKDGNVTKCVAMTPQPDAELVDAACRALKKMKYQPAIDADDKPVASQSVVPVRWRIP